MEGFTRYCPICENPVEDHGCEVSMPSFVASHEDQTVTAKQTVRCKVAKLVYGDWRGAWGVGTWRS